MSSRYVSRYKCTLGTCICTSRSNIGRDTYISKLDPEVQMHVPNVHLYLETYRDDMIYVYIYISIHTHTCIYICCSPQSRPPPSPGEGRGGRVPEISEYALQSSLSPLWFWVKSNDSLSFP